MALTLPFYVLTDLAKPMTYHNGNEDYLPVFSTEQQARSFFANDVGKPDYKEGPGHDWEVKLVDNQQDSQVVIDSSFVKSYCLNPTKPGDDKIVLPF